MFHRQMFETEEAVYIPATESDSAIWTSPDSCVWKAHDFLEGKFRLASKREYEENSRLGELFMGILRIPNGNWMHSMEELERRAELGIRSDNVADIYRHIWEGLLNKDDQFKSVR
jgi:hypothetical protein